VETKPRSLLLDRLNDPGPFAAVELRPPRSGLRTREGMDAWIDLRHAIRRLSKHGTFTFLTDDAVGSAEEESLAHVSANIGPAADLRRIVPILTAKHTLSYCRTFASRAVSEGMDALTVTGGDRRVGPERCVPHGSDLRALLRKMEYSGKSLPLALGGWVNPHKGPDPQLHHIVLRSSRADFALTQIVSHHSLSAVEAFLEALERRRIEIPMIFGVFFYRSSNAQTLQRLGNFFPVPATQLTTEFGQGADPFEICARSIRGLWSLGIRKIYVSNLRAPSAQRGLGRLLEVAGVRPWPTRRFG